MSSSLASLDDVAARLRENNGAFREAFLERLVIEEPQSHGLFPLTTASQHLRIAEVLAFGLEHSDDAGVFDGSALRRLRALGVEVRRLSFPAQAYPMFVRSAKVALRAMLAHEGLDYTRACERAEVVFEAIFATMADAAYSADLEGLAPAYSGSVSAITRPTASSAVVTVVTGLPVPYLAGQHFPVTSHLLPGVWLPLSPATPPNDAGQVSFFISAIDDDHQVLTRSQPGDQWTIGQARGQAVLREDEPGPVLIVADIAGVAAARALIFELLERETAPITRVHLCAEYPGEIQEFERLSLLARVSSWLTVTASATHAVDPWWLGTGDAVASSEIAQSDSPVKSVVASLEQADEPITAWRAIVIGQEVFTSKVEKVLTGAGVGSVILDALDATPQW